MGTVNQQYTYATSIEVFVNGKGTELIAEIAFSHYSGCDARYSKAMGNWLPPDDPKTDIEELKLYTTVRNPKTDNVERGSEIECPGWLEETIFKTVDKVTLVESLPSLIEGEGEGDSG